MKADMIVIIDCGGSQAYYTARKLRVEGFYCELLDLNATANDIRATDAKGIILIGDDVQSVCDEPFAVDYASLGLPVLAFGSASRRLALTDACQSGGTEICERAAFVHYGNYPLFAEMRETDHYFHRVDALSFTGEWKVMAETPEGCPIIFGKPDKNIFAFQGYIEANDPEGLHLLRNFADVICACKPMPGTSAQIAEIVDMIREEVGSGSVLLPVFMSAESAVTAKLFARAIGNRLTCIFIDTGLMRAGDVELITRCYSKEMDMNFIEHDASDRFLKVLKDNRDPHGKRESIRREFSTILAEQFVKLPDMERIAIGTTYSDILKHKDDLLYTALVGQTPIEPLSRMFRDEILAFADALGIPEVLTTLAPFTVSGLSIRCLGEVTRERLELLRRAETIFHEEIENAGYTRKIAQSFLILTDLITHGEHGNGYVCVLRALNHSTCGRASAYRLPYDLMENAVLRITSEIPGIARVVYDITGRPTADLEWE